MNYNDNKNNKQRYNDDLDIKSSLNESLDLNGITVSEELINKTLNAIKNQSSEAANNSESKNINHKEDKVNRLVLWNGYVRRFAGAAAVVLVVFAGFSMMRLIGEGGKKDTATPQYSQDLATKQKKQDNQANSDFKNETGNSDDSSESIMAGGGSKEDTKQAGDSQVSDSQEAASQKAVMDDFASEDNSGISAKKSSQTSTGTVAKKSAEERKAVQKASGNTSSDKSSVQESKSDSKKEASTQQKAITDTTTSKQQVSEKMMPKISADRKEDADASAESVPKMALKGTIADDNLKFINICPLSQEEIGSIKITLIASGTSISISNLSDINDFYTRMEKYQFQQGTGTSDGGVYTIEIESPTVVPGLYTITVGNNVSVRYMIEDQVTETIYQLTDIEGLKTELEQIVTSNGN